MEEDDILITIEQHSGRAQIGEMPRGRTDRGIRVSPYGEYGETSIGAAYRDDEWAYGKYGGPGYGADDYWRL